MLSPLTDCFSLHNVVEPSYVNILSPTPDSIISEEKFTSNQSQNDDHHQLFDLDAFTFDARDYFNFESFVSDAVRRKSLDDAIFLRRISSTTPIKSEISFQQQLNRRRSLPSEFSQQRIQIEDDFSQITAIKSSKSLAPFACPHEHCSKTFTRQYNLKSHLRTHTDERPFICTYPGCPRAFARQHDLKRHQKLHLGLKPHVCGNCGRAFARLDALNRHLRSDNAAQCAQVTMANNNNSSIGKLFKSNNI
ncbi:12783_t:CDS:2 [Entrophospora sp. SA101]|nr:11504_t:CDS:2 [Entrophospora candida]CAH1762692.1 2372_t:CDS:2 [Entrophospora sp. SA101]CAG8444313.1 2488_t:CDS:2 [Entrophospora candida]CAJ0746236.1 5752_t:CDS:2 [Entrophospora sp. SA101]CAJ0761472.1 12783_t:CDS:2 [Entrophospora sp. SA101]